MEPAEGRLMKNQGEGGQRGGGGGGGEDEEGGKSIEALSKSNDSAASPAPP